MKLLIVALLITFALCDNPEKFNLQSVFDELFAQADLKTSQVSFDLLRSTDRNCAGEKLNLANFNPEIAFEDAIVVIYSASFLCKPDLDDYLGNLFDKTLTILTSESHAENFDCYQLAVFTLDPNSRLVQGFNENSITKQNCKKIATEARGEALSAAFGGFHESTYGADGQENMAIMYKLLLLANGNFSEELKNFAKNHYKDDFKKKSMARIQKILSVTN